MVISIVVLAHLGPLENQVDTANIRVQGNNVRNPNQWDATAAEEKSLGESQPDKLYADILCYKIKTILKSK